MDIPQFLNKKDFYLASIAENREVLKYIPNEARNNELYQAAIKDVRWLKFVPEEQYQDEKMCMAIAMHDKKIFDFFLNKFESEEFYFAAFQQGYVEFKEIPEEYKSKDLYLYIIEMDEFIDLDDISDKIIDKDIYYSAYLKDLITFEDIPNKYKNKEICSKYIQEGNYLCHIPLELRDRELCLAAFEKNVAAITDVPEHLLDKEICLMAVRKDGRLLRDVPNAMRDREICLAAVQSRGTALEHVPKHIRDKELCLAAVQQHGLALKDVPAPVKDANVCLAAVGQTGSALKYVPAKLRDSEICSVALLNAPPDKMSEVRSNVPKILAEKLQNVVTKIPEKSKKSSHHYYADPFEEWSTFWKYKDEKPQLELLKNNEKFAIDYEKTNFSIVFNEQCKPALKSASGKIFKNLPKSKNTDDEKVAEAQLFWSLLRDDLKSEESKYLSCLKETMSRGLWWNLKSFKRIMEEHPLLPYMLKSLVWHTEADGELIFFMANPDGDFLDQYGRCIELEADAHNISI